MDRDLPPPTTEVDPLVTDAVQNVRDRFGAEGLRDLLALAQSQLREAEAAERRLAETAVETAEDADAADTQAWLAYREVDEEAGDRR